MGLSTWVLKLDSLDLDPRSRFNMVLSELHKTCRLHTLHCQPGTHTHFIMHTVTQLKSGSRMCVGKVVFESGSPIPIGFRSKFPCREPLYQIKYRILQHNFSNAVTQSMHIFFLPAQRLKQLPQHISNETTSPLSSAQSGVWGGGVKRLDCNA